MSNNVKKDEGKSRWDLLMWEEVEEVVKVLTFGARKYPKDSWSKIPNPKERYFSACTRHVIAWWRGEELDPESGLSHLAHAVCNLLFLLKLLNMKKIK